jgi:hypothetical protein
VRFARTDFFKSDYKRLSKANQELFRQAAREFNEACDQFVVANNPSSWPAKLRVKSVVNAPGVFEMRWNFSGPDGRATWERTTATDAKGATHPAVRWRRLGDHKIFRNP